MDVDDEWEIFLEGGDDNNLNPPKSLKITKKI